MAGNGEALTLAGLGQAIVDLEVERDEWRDKVFKLVYESFGKKEETCSTYGG